MESHDLLAANMLFIKLTSLETSASSWGMAMVTRMLG